MKTPTYFNHGLGLLEIMSPTNPAPTSNNNLISYLQPKPQPIATIVPVTSVSPTSAYLVQQTPTATAPETLINVVTATMTLKTIVADSVGVLPLATVKIDNDKFSTTEAGIFQKTNVNIDSLVTISYVGYKSFTAKASAIPQKVVLQENSEQLDEVKIITKKKTNWWAWLALGVATAVVVKKATQKPKPVKAKI